MMNHPHTVSNLLANAGTTDLMAILNSNMFRYSNQSPILSNTMSKKRALHEICDVASTASSSSSNSSKRSRFQTGHYLEKDTKISKVYPSKEGLTTYAPSDVLSGRGGGTNQHEGNCYFRALINENREKYLRAKKNDKPFISLSIVNTVRRRNGRFLKKNEKTNLWFEIGDAAAREKTSQALRQRAPEYRRHIFAKDSEALNQPLTKHIAVSEDLANMRGGTISPTMSFESNPVPVSPCRNNGVILRALRQAQLEEARETLRLQQKLQTIKALEFMIKATGSNRFNF